ncbi:MAG: hypothetical protein HFH08_05540 [Bacilli bacterium]|nr:hypothetical protein [Bacilli bacterium]
MEKDIKIFGCLPGLIEIPADMLLYWTLKATNFKGTISERELQNYRVAICKAYDRLRPNLKEVLGFNFPYANNYQSEVFEAVSLSNGKIGFRIAQKKGKKAKELLEYRLVKLKAFERGQRPIVQEMFAMAEEFYRKENIVSTLQERKTMKQKVFQIVQGVQLKFNPKK